MNFSNPKRFPPALPVAAIFVGLIGVQPISGQILAIDSRQDAPARRANLSVTAVGASETTNGRSSVVFEVTIANRGPHAAEAVLLEMIVDKAALKLFEDRRIEPTRRIRCVIETLVCEIGELAASDRITLNVSGALPASAPLSSFGMEIRVSAKTIDSMPFDNRYYTSTFLKKARRRVVGI